MEKRVLGRTRAIVSLLAGLTLVPLWLAVPSGSPVARRLARRFHRAVAEGHGLSIRVHGQPCAWQRVLFVANHVSWIDIPVLASLLDAAFVAKNDVGGWPVIGALARRAGTIFIARERPRGAGEQQRELAHRLIDDGVILFPEGTTSDGSGLLPFRTSLFAAASDAAMIQPVTLVYGRSDCNPLTMNERRLIAWLDDDALLPHAMRLARASGLCVDVYFEQPVPVTDRKILAQSCRRSILDRLLGEDQAATLNRVA